MKVYVPRKSFLHKGYYIVDETDGGVMAGPYFTVDTARKVNGDEYNHECMIYNEIGLQEFWNYLDQHGEELSPEALPQKEMFKGL